MSNAAASGGGDFLSDFTRPDDSEMSDISVFSDYPFEIRPSDGRGMGAFATRDVAPGEIVLVDYTSISIVDSGLIKDCETIADLYESLYPDEQEKWEALAATANERHTTATRWVYSRPRSDGTSYPKEKQEKYTMLKLQFNCNGFDMLQGGSALFLDASRFNHSCDPNLWYDVDTMDNRWVGRANRKINEGEEIFVSYIPENRTRDVRQKSLKGWGFDCTCPKCSEGIDTYSASLETARDIANRVEPDRGRSPPVYGNTTDDIGKRIDRHIEILRDLSQKQGRPNEDKSIQKELVFA
ncbi:hypothetical protein EKO27_g7985 [Xylaria grammica]|uniref:SET domain-containing protein n=1 Tax=Xylaria grammica TaxID=363999 RepID=A0A439CYB2_9PEZI|nr:hypothetical protein EKO27_g7985 [Xylaria grammica]